MNSMISSVFALIKEIFEEEKIIQLDVRNVKIQDAVVNYDFVHTIEIDPSVVTCDPLFVVKVERAEKVKKQKLSKLQTFKEKQNQDVCNMIDLCESILFEASKYRVTKNADIRTACGVDEIFATVSDITEPQIEETDENETEPITLESDDDIIVSDSDDIGYNKPRIILDTVDSSEDDIVENDVVDSIVDSVDEHVVVDIVVNNGKVQLNTTHPNYITLVYEFDHLCTSYLNGDDIETMRAIGFEYHEDFDEFFRLLNNEDKIEDLPELQEPEDEEPKETEKCGVEDDEDFDEIFRLLNSKETCESKKPSEEHRDLTESTTFHSTPKNDEELLNFYREICERKANAPKKDKFEALVETIKNLDVVIDHLVHGSPISNGVYGGLTNAKATLKSKLRMVKNYLGYTAEELEKIPKAETEIKNLINWLSCECGFFPSFVVDVEENREFYKLLLQFINSSYSTDYKLQYRSRTTYNGICGIAYLRAILAPTKKSYFKDECIAFYSAYNDIFKANSAFIRYDAENKKFVNIRG